jgi:membrane protein
MTKQGPSYPLVLFLLQFGPLLFPFFGIWVIQFSQYNQLYGSIGTLLIMMFYIGLTVWFYFWFWVKCHDNEIKKKQYY